MSNALRTVLEEPQPPDPPVRVWRDWALLTFVTVSGVLEGFLREDLPLPGLSVVLAVGLAPLLLWRRTHPLAVVAAAFGVVAVVDIGLIASDAPALDMYTMLYFMLLPYALFRWGSGRDAVAGLAIILVAATMSFFVSWTGVADAVGGVAVLMSTFALGWAVRSQHGARERRLEQVKSEERVLLARELHDTVAHHVSGIVIQAQAGRAVAMSHPERAAEVLAVIEDAASRTLTELRTIVGVLRAPEGADFAPRTGVADLERLADQTEGGPQVDVELSGELDDLSPAVGAALYRLTQESVTNARRHARHATRVAVRVVGDAERVQLTVDDDGAVSSAGGNPSGYGLVGMRERAKLLGGTFDAGPSTGGGWRVEAMLPRAGAPR
ncbi:sensor histidine kinase [Luteipulveratus mongoliensis]|uniref:histidine kinase n=1 Tax=Luteipulveratus mongoliensis TaxID=571913 RepID=A0A0K1JE87_9MICO|nr:sensor histidine kinase [Luteipulveratus mongoliensis]AKU15019.1 histidine kinase [Luteipulveratus mongoliensis]